MEFLLGKKKKKGISSSHNNGMEGEVVNLRFIGCLYNTHKKKKHKKKIYIYILVQPHLQNSE